MASIPDLTCEVRCDLGITMNIMHCLRRLLEAVRDQDCIAERIESATLAALSDVHGMAAAARATIGIERSEVVIGIRTHLDLDLDDDKWHLQQELAACRRRCMQLQASLMTMIPVGAH